MFDRSKHFLVKIISGGIKSALLKFPDDAQWCGLARRKHTVRTSVGRDKSIIENASTEEAELDLFRALCVNEADRNGFDSADAAAFIARLDRAEITEAEWDGAQARRIEMSVPGAAVVHVLRIPRQSDIRDYESASATPVFSRKRTEIRHKLEPAGDLYDKIVDGTEGYTGSIPINHKVAAVSELLDALPSLLEGEESAPESQSLVTAGGQSDQASGS